MSRYCPLNNSINSKKIKCFFRVQQFIQGVSIEQYCPNNLKNGYREEYNQTCYENVGNKLYCEAVQLSNECNH